MNPSNLKHIISLLKGIGFSDREVQAWLEARSVLGEVDLNLDAVMELLKASGGDPLFRIGPCVDPEKPGAN